MEASRDDLRHTEVFTADFAQVTGMDVSLEGENYSMVCQQEDDDDEAVWLCNDEEFNINALQSAIEGLAFLQLHQWRIRPPMPKRK